MASIYPNQNDEELISDLLKRKEYYWLKRWDNDRISKLVYIKPRFSLMQDILNYGKLDYTGYQLFVQNFMDPNSDNKRLLLMWNTGSGKTLASLGLAYQYISRYRQEQEANISEIGTVFIIGFSHRIFQNELLRRPEFGFVSREERVKLEKLKRLAATGSKYDVEKYKEALIRIKKKFGNRKGNGFFKFDGYKSFVNKIFEQSHIDGRRDLSITNMSENDILDAIRDGKLKLNKELVAKFKNSLLICDEFHNCYNSIEKNNWGIAIQIVLSQEPSCRAIFCTATPLNNSPTEIVDVINILQTDKTFERSEFFPNGTKKVTEKTLALIAQYTKGRISFIQDINPRYYPSISFEGEEIANIKYLKFIRCPMSKLHYDTYKLIYNGSLGQDSIYLTDFVIPNPFYGDKSNEDHKLPGLYQTRQVSAALISADPKWKNDIGIDLIDNVITGSALLYDTIGKYSMKYKIMLQECFNNLKTDSGKIFIYHSNVHMSGVLFIEQIMLYNGFIDEYGNPNDDTLCSVCGKQYSVHKKYGGKSQQHVIKVKVADRVKTKRVMKSKTCANQHVDVDHQADAETTNIYTNDTVVRSGNLYTWYNKGNEMVVFKLCKYDSVLIKKRPNKFIYYAKAADLNIDLINGKSWALDTFSNILDVFDAKKINIVVQAPHYSIAFGDWLIHCNFRLLYQTTKYSYLIYKGEQIQSDKPKANIKLINKKSGGNAEHLFMPARYIMARGEIDKVTLEHSLEKYNDPENANGYKYRILIGSSIMRESYDIKCVQNVFIMNKPDNIPELVQIRGRAVRKNSHIDLPQEKRHVYIKLFTSSVPGFGELSYEEDRYKEKVNDYIEIQKIEKVLHEVSVDSFLNYDTNTKMANDPLAPLPYAKNFDIQSKLSLDELNLATFDNNVEIKIIKVIIKRLFIELASVWEYNQLFQAVKDTKYEKDINVKLISEDNFLIALDQLSWYNSREWVESIVEYSDMNIISRLYNNNDKMIVMPGIDTQYVITPIDAGAEGQYFILFPTRYVNGQYVPDIDIETPYRVIRNRISSIINMDEFVQNKKIDFDYDEKKNIFFRRYADISIENMENVICDYGTTFHIKFVEECIEYVFRAWTDPNAEMHHMHEFYFKMLYYYDLMSLVIFAYTCKPRIFKNYVKYAIPVKAKDIKLKVMNKYEKRKEELEDISPDDTSDLASSGIINLLKSTLNRTSNMWIPREFREQYEKTLEQNLALYNGRVKKIKQPIKVSAEYLPIGHYIGKFPKLYHPTMEHFEKSLNKASNANPTHTVSFGYWIEDPLYVQNDQEFIENDLIIGYDDKSKTGVHIRFKLRSPIHNIKQYKDSRLIEKGTVCKSKSKSYLISLAKKLDVSIPEEINVDELCVLIRSKLIRLELKERIKKSKIKYHYFIFENHQNN